MKGLTGQAARVLAASAQTAAARRAAFRGGAAVRAGAPARRVAADSFAAPAPPPRWASASAEARDLPQPTAARDTRTRTPARPPARDRLPRKCAHGRQANTIFESGPSGSHAWGRWLDRGALSRGRLRKGRARAAADPLGAPPRTRRRPARPARSFLRGPQTHSLACPGTSLRGRAAPPERGLAASCGVGRERFGRGSRCLRPSAGSPLPSAWDASSSGKGESGRRDVGPSNRQSRRQWWWY